jgi:hypothetical protein
MTKLSPQAIQGVDKRGLPLQGLKSGKVTELSMFYKVKPGHEEAIREAIYEFLGDPKRDVSLPEAEKKACQIGIHEMRLTLFDNDTRLAWWTSFDSDWDPYIDDTFAAVGLEIYGKVLMHTLEAPEGIEKPGFPNAATAAKDLFNANRITAAGYSVTLGKVPLTDQMRNRAIREAFDASLNEPGAAEALAHPALKRLLDLAAD